AAARAAVTRRGVRQASDESLRRAARPLHAGQRQNDARPRASLDADGAPSSGGRLQDVSPHPPARALSPSRLRVPEARSLVSHRRFLPSREQPRVRGVAGNAGTADAFDTSAARLRGSAARLRRGTAPSLRALGDEVGAELVTAATLAGRVCILAGGTGGIGAVLARALHDEGAALVLGYRADRERAERVAATLRSSSPAAVS